MEPTPYIEKPYVVKHPSGLYGRLIGEHRWEWTSDKRDATPFTQDEARGHLRTLNEQGQAGTHAERLDMEPAVPASAVNALTAITELIVGLKAPPCYAPEPERVVQCVREVLEQRSELQEQVKRADAAQSELHTDRNRWFARSRELERDRDHWCARARELEQFIAELSNSARA